MSKTHRVNKLPQIRLSAITFRRRMKCKGFKENSKLEIVLKNKIDEKLINLNFDADVRENDTPKGVQ